MSDESVSDYDRYYDRYLKETEEEEKYKSGEDSYNSGESCYCGRDDGDGGVKQCKQCKQYVCSNKCSQMPGIVKTDKGDYCTDCLEVDDVVLIYPDTSFTPRGRGRQYINVKCDRCKIQLHSWSDGIIRLMGKELCRNCLDTIVSEAFEDENSNDSSC